MNYLRATTLVSAVLLLGCHVDSVFTGAAEQEMFGHVCAGNIHEVKKFLDDGGNVNTQDEPGCTPLHWAVNEDLRGSHREMVELLIDRGADVNIRDDTLTTPLHLASNKETAELLIDAGADVDAEDSEGKTILRQKIGDGQMHLTSLKALIPAPFPSMAQIDRSPRRVRRLSGRFGAGLPFLAFDKNTVTKV